VKFPVIEFSRWIIDSVGRRFSWQDRIENTSQNTLLVYLKVKLSACICSRFIPFLTAFCYIVLSVADKLILD
jgi:hypothetical protein